MINKCTTENINSINKSYFTVLANWIITGTLYPIIHILIGYHI